MIPRSSLRKLSTYLCFASIIVFHSSYALSDPTPNEEDLQKFLEHNKCPNCDLRGLDLTTSDADFSGANLEGADLRDAQIYNASFNGANFRRAKLNGASFEDGFVSGADFSHANLTDTDFGGAIADGAIFEGTNLSGTQFRYTSLVAANFKNATIRSTNFSSADLTNASVVQAKIITTPDFSDVDLTSVDLGSRSHILNFDCEKSSVGNEVECTNLAFADLSGQELIGVSFKGANLRGTNLSNAFLQNTVFECIQFDFIDPDTNMAWVRCADLSDTDMSIAELSGASLVGANVENASLRWSTVREADLTRSNLSRVDLRNADLTGSNLASADFTSAMLDGSVFDPRIDPGIRTIPVVLNPLSLTWAESAAGLVWLRGVYDSQGLSTQVRNITYVIRSQQNRNNPYFIERFLNYIIFDVTSLYGSRPSRLIELFLWVYLLGFFVFWYASIAPNKDKGAIWIVWPKAEDRILGSQDGYTIISVGVRKGALWGAYFSLLTSFHIGWRDLNVRNWISNINPKDFSMRATGWVKVYAGIQSLFSVFFIAMWFFTFFGTPFK